MPFVKMDSLTPSTFETTQPPRNTSMKVFHHFILE
jgi:hypothetical protein